jgi:hypothetical protein
LHFVNTDNRRACTQPKPNERTEFNALKNSKPNLYSHANAYANSDHHPNANNHTDPDDHAHVNNYPNTDLRLS